MWRADVLLVLSLAVYVKTDRRRAENADLQLSYCANPNGVYPVENSDCRKYVICHEGEASFMSCPIGLLFNPDRNWCDLPQNVNCNSTLVEEPDSKPMLLRTLAPYTSHVDPAPAQATSVQVPVAPLQESCPRDDSSFPIPSSDCRKYILCHNGKAVLMECPAGLIYNPVNNWCDLQQNVLCNSSVAVIPSTTPAPYQTTVSTTPKYPDFTSTKVPIQTPVQAFIPPQYDNICPERDGSFPIPSSDCRKYLLCQEGLATAMECPPGLAFNPNNNWCDLPENVRCNSNVAIVSTSTSAPDRFPASTTPKYPVSVQTQAPAPTPISVQAYVPPQHEKCPKRDGSFPIPSSDCRKYLLCQDGKATVMECPPGLSFNSNNNWCDLPQNVPCNSSVVVIPTPPTNPIPVSTTPIYPVSLQTQPPIQTLTPVQALVPPQNDKCPEQDGSFPIPSSGCRKYLLCRDGKATVMECPPGLAFDPNNNWCDLPQNVPCNSNVAIVSTSTSAPDRVPSSTTPKYVVFVQTQAPTQTQTPHQALVPLQQEVCPKRDGSFPIPSSDCRKYMVCRDGKATLMECPPGLAFNPNNIWCDLPQNVHCNSNEGLVPTSSAPVHILDSTTLKYPISMETQASTQYVTQVPTTSQQENCPSRNGFFPLLSSDCRKYMFCLDGMATILNCPHGLAFNSNKNVCDLPENVQCNSNLVVPSVSTPTTIPTTVPTPAMYPVVTPTQEAVKFQTPVQVPTALQRVACPSPDGIFPISSNDCMYMVCQGGQATIMGCPSGLAFCPNKQGCDWLQNVTCNSNLTSPSFLPPPAQASAATPSSATGFGPGSGPAPTAGPNPDLAIAPAPALTSVPGIVHVPAPTTTNAPASTTTPVTVFAPNFNSGFATTPAPVFASVPAPTPNSAYIPALAPAVTLAPIPASSSALAPVFTPTPVPTHPGPVFAPALAPGLTLANVSSQGPSLNPGLASLPILGVPTNFNCHQNDGYHAIVNECDTYIVCQNNVAYKASCPDGLHFNPEANWPNYACEYSAKVQCVSGAIELPAISTAQCPRQYGFFPMSDGECSKYIRCHEGIMTIMNCPSGLVFNPKENTCDWPENVPLCNPDVLKGYTCPEAPFKDGRRLDLYKYRFNHDCSLFVACHKGSPRLLSCDAGKSFDEASQSCIASANVANC